MESPSQPTPLPSLLSRMVGVLTSPRATFVQVATHPSWVGALLLTAGVVTLTSALLFATPVGRQALLDQRVDTLEGFGQTVDDARYTLLQAHTTQLAVEQIGVYAVGLPVATLAIAWLGHAWLGGKAAGTSLAQALAVTAHAGAVIVARFLVLSPWNYLRESLGSPLNASVAFPAIDEGGFLSSFLGSLDLFAVWWAVVLATGLAVLYHQKVRTVATRVFVAYGAIALAIAGAKSALGAQ